MRALVLIVAVLLAPIAATGQGLGYEGAYGVAGGRAVLDELRGFTTSRSLPDLLLFGGKNNDTFLGCLTCARFDAASLENRFGRFGNPLSADSVFNRFGPYGSQFSDFSPCNRFANNPPVVVDRGGGYYGEITINALNPNRTHSKLLIAWVTAVCK